MMPSHLELVTGTYPNGNTSVRLTRDGEPYAHVSVDIDIPLPDGEFVLKAFSEGESIAAELLASGIIADTRRRVRVGLAGEMPVCRVC